MGSLRHYLSRCLYRLCFRLVKASPMAYPIPDMGTDPGRNPADLIRRTFHLFNDDIYKESPGIFLTLRTIITVSRATQLEETMGIWPNM